MPRKLAKKRRISYTKRAPKRSSTENSRATSLLKSLPDVIWLVGTAHGEGRVLICDIVCSKESLMKLVNSADAALVSTSSVSPCYGRTLPVEQGTLRPEVIQYSSPPTVPYSTNTTADCSTMWMKSSGRGGKNQKMLLANSELAYRTIGRTLSELGYYEASPPKKKSKGGRRGQTSK